MIRGRFLFFKKKTGQETALRRKPHTNNRARSTVLASLAEMPQRRGASILFRTAQNCFHQKKLIGGINIPARWLCLQLVWLVFFFSKTVGVRVESLT